MKKLLFLLVLSCGGRELPGDFPKAYRGIYGNLVPVSDGTVKYLVEENETFVMSYVKVHKVERDEINVVKGENEVEKNVIVKLRPYAFEAEVRVIKGNVFGKNVAGARFKLKIEQLLHDGMFLKQANLADRFKISCEDIEVKEDLVCSKYGIESIYEQQYFFNKEKNNYFEQKIIREFEVRN